MIALHEALLIERVEVKHSLPNRRVVLAGRAVRFERDIRHRGVVNDRLQVVARKIGFVSAHFVHHKVASRGVHKRLELRAVVRVRSGNLNAGYRFDLLLQLCEQFSFTKEC